MALPTNTDALASVTNTALQTCNLSFINGTVIGFVNDFPYLGSFCVVVSMLIPVLLLTYIFLWSKAFLEGRRYNKAIDALRSGISPDKINAIKV